MTKCYLCAAKLKKENVNILLKELKKIKGIEKAMMFSYTGDLSE